MYDTILLRTELATILMHIVLFYDQMKKSYKQVNSRLQQHLKIIFMLAKIANASENVVEFFFFFAFGPVFVYWNHCYRKLCSKQDCVEHDFAKANTEEVLGQKLKIVRIFFFLPAPKLAQG